MGQIGCAEASVKDCVTFEDEIDRICRNASSKVPVYAAQNSRRGGSLKSRFAKYVGGSCLGLLEDTYITDWTGLGVYREIKMC
jgi:hypothetical protein